MGLPVLGEPFYGEDLGLFWSSTGNARHESTGSPSTRTVQVPHSPSSHPCLVPVSRRSSRKHFEKRLVERHRDVDGLAVHGEMQKLLVSHGSRRLYHARMG